MTDEKEPQPWPVADGHGEADLTSLFVDERYSEILALILQALPERQVRIMPA
jgi:hypothetical protein